MFFRALAAFLALPGLFALAVPPVIAHFDPWKGEAPFMPGVAVIAAGFAVVVACVRDFYVSGKGTLAPWDPPKKMVVIGLYRFARNPMYIGVVLLVTGWCIFSLSPLLAVYDLVLLAGFHMRVVTHEEPWLERMFSDEWMKYRNGVPRWIPRFRPWRG